jgi:hypothetical protein
VRKLINEAELYMNQEEKNLRADRAAYELLVQHLVGLSRDDAAAYVAHAEGKPLETSHVIGEIKATRPLAVLRAEEVAALRDWAEGRTVPAD